MKLSYSQWTIRAAKRYIVEERKVRLPVYRKPDSYVDLAVQLGFRVPQHDMGTHFLRINRKGNCGCKRVGRKSRPTSSFMGRSDC